VTRYIGLDVHKASCSMVVMGESGRILARHVVETNGSALVDLIKAIPRPRRLCLEEGTHSAWLHELLSKHVDDLIVTTKTDRRGNKDDMRDATELAERMRTNSLKTRVYKQVGCYGRLRDLSHAHAMQVGDSARVQNRIRSMFRSRGIETDDTLYSQDKREAWLMQLPVRSQRAAELLFRQYDAVEPLRRECEKEMLLEARKYKPWKLLRSVPGIGTIRAAQLLSIIVTPHRFRTRKQLWQYGGLGVVEQVSAEWEKTKGGSLRRVEQRTTRGLNRNHNRPLKTILKGAATTVVQQASPECSLYLHYQAMLANKIDPHLAKLTLARQIAAIVLSIWKQEVVYDPARLRRQN
jgi:transposase